MARNWKASEFAQDNSTGPMGLMELHIVKRVPVEFGGAKTVGQRVDEIIALAAQEGDTLTRFVLNWPKEHTGE